MKAWDNLVRDASKLHSSKKLHPREYSTLLIFTEFVPALLSSKSNSQTGYFVPVVDRGMLSKLLGGAIIRANNSTNCDESSMRRESGSDK